MTSVARFELILLLIAITVGLELVARRLRLPPAAALILGGIGLALIPGAPGIELDPDLALVLFLPPLLLSSAFFTTWRDFRADLRIILHLAVGAVLFTTLAVGWVAHLVMPGLPWAACFALGAIVSPPDAVTAKAVLHGLRLPPRMVVLLEGESLVNDASGLVLYRFAVAAALTGVFDGGQAVLSFGVLAVGGVVAGVAFGFVVSTLIGRLRDPQLAVIASFLAAWGAYIGGEALHVSGVLATVACGLVMGWRQHVELSAITRTQARAVWGVAEFVLESLVFILIGLSMRGVMQRLGHDFAGALSILPQAAAIVAAVVVSRFVWILPSTYAIHALSPRHHRDPVPPIGVPIVMSWAGMRGVVSLAAALALPEGFPGRDFIVATTFGVILVTVLVQGLTLAPLIRHLRLGAVAAPRLASLTEAEARGRMAAAELAAVQRLSVSPDGTHRHPRLLEHFGYRAKAAGFLAADAALSARRTEHFAVILAAVAAGRTELLRLHRAGEIHDTVLHSLEQELDIEEIGAQHFGDGE